MFAEVEWTDSLPAKEDPPTEFKKTEGLSRKSKKISKRCLKQTLQTLGPVPRWDDVRVSDGSDEEMEEGTVHTVKKKKKKCKKRKKNVSDAEQQQGDLAMSEIPAKKQRTKQKRREPRSSASVKDENAAVQPKGNNQMENASENKLTRKQWKNKMKNKKRHKNKFLLNAAGVSKEDLKTAKLDRTEGLSKEEISQEDLSLERLNSRKEGEFVNGNTDTPNNEKATKTKNKQNKDTSHLPPVASECESKQSKDANNVIQKLTDPHEDCKKQRPARVDKRSQILKKILKGHVTESSKNLTIENQETVNTRTEQQRNLNDRSSALRLRMEKRLESARFRYINELLYTSTSGEAKRMFKQDPDAIGIYHKGYIEQVKHWPANPVDSIISYIRQKPASLVVADFGCGDCKIARSVKNKVHCFDLAPVCDLVTACDMAHVPLADSTVDIAVFCLSLMGTNLGDFLAEANRVLVDGGILKIAEVASRFDDERQFTGALSRLGFKLVSKDTENTHFYSFDFIKIRNALVNVKKLGLQLKPCLYKKR